MANHRNKPARTGWVWVVIAFVGVGLIVWWIASAVSDDDQVGPSQETAAIEETEPRGQQDGTNGSSVGQQQGYVEGRNVGPQERPGQPERAQPERLEQFRAWSQQQQGQLNQEQAAQGMQMLQGAIDDVLAQANGVGEDRQLGDGQGQGGGPIEGTLDSPQIDQYRQQVQESMSNIEQAPGEEQSATFQRAASDVAALLKAMQEQGNMQTVEQPVEEVQRAAQSIRPDQPLDQQEQVVQTFFEGASVALNQMSANFEPTSPTTAPTYQQ